GRPLITDFGLAHVAGAAPSPTRPVSALGSSSMIGVSGGTVFGTPAYMAPERFAAGAAAGQQGDVFAFCCSVFEVLYGRRPFHGDTIDELRAAIATAPKPPEHALVPARVLAVLTRGLAADRNVRYRSMTALLAALQPAPRPARWLAAGAMAAA